MPGLLSEMMAAEDPMAPKAPHFPAKAKRVIFLYMTGGCSQVDSFDPKPQLTLDHGKKVQNRFSLVRSPFAFKHYGQSGIEVSDLFPHVGECVDDMCVIRSMKNDDNGLFTERQPGPLAALLGGRVEQYYALDSTIPISGDWGTSPTKVWAELLSTSNPELARRYEFEGNIPSRDDAARQLQWEGYFWGAGDTDSAADGNALEDGDDLIPGLIPSRGIVVVVADSGLGKSAFQYQQAFCLNHNGPYRRIRHKRFVIVAKSRLQRRHNLAGCRRMGRGGGGDVAKTEQ